MPRFEYQTHLPFSRHDVFDWYSRPGTLVRLHPPFAGRVLQEPDEGLTEGSESTLGINLPGLWGTALAAAAEMAGQALPIPLRGWLRWQARHTGYEPDRRLDDEMLSGPAASWQHQREFTDDGAGAVLHETVDYRLPLLDRLPSAVADPAARRFEAELRRIFDFRARQTSMDLAFHQGYGRLASQQAAGQDDAPDKAGVVALSGASGMIGRQVRALLGGAGVEVRRLVRAAPDDVAASAGEIAWDPSAGRLDPSALEDVDVVIHLAGHPLAARFTEDHKKKVLASRVQGTELIAETLAQLEKADGRGRALVSGSAIGFYGARPMDREHDDELLTEEHPPGRDFLADVCRRWEAATRPAEEAGVRVVTIRTGLVQSPAGGVLAQMLPLFAIGAGGPLGQEQWQSWIGLDDITGLIVHAAFTPSVEGPVNAAAPNPVTARQYARTLAAVMHRPAAIPVPSFGPALLLGAEGARQLAQADQRVSAERAIFHGYGFRHTQLDAALRHLLGR